MINNFFCFLHFCLVVYDKVQSKVFTSYILNLFRVCYYLPYIWVLECTYYWFGECFVGLTWMQQVHVASSLGSCLSSFQKNWELWLYIRTRYLVFDNRGYNIRVKYLMFWESGLWTQWNHLDTRWGIGCSF
jgi:hypothetical protein